MKGAEGLPRRPMPPQEPTKDDETFSSLFIDGGNPPCNPFSQGTHTIMTRFLTCICVLVGTALTVAAGSDTPSPEPQHGEAKSQARIRPKHPRRMRFLRMGNRNGRTRRGAASQLNRDALNTVTPSRVTRSVARA